MKDFIHIALQIAGFIAGTYLLWFCFLFLGSGHSALTIIAILGILGYIGLFLLFLERHINNWIIIALLLCGSASFLSYMTLDGLWSRMEFKDLPVWLFYMLPTIVALINIVRLTSESLKKRNAL